MKVVHSWLKDYLGESLPPAEKVEELLNFHAFEIDGVEELSGESVIEVDVLPNRASDCLCHRGIARELASILDIPLTHDPLKEPVELKETDKISIRIADHEACPRFTAALISGIEVKASPVWLQDRLKALGQRPINNIVDATNYVMYALGQPLHAYDADLFPKDEGQWKFAVRFAEEKETVSLLAEGGSNEDRVVELKGTELLIVDESTNTPVSLAGVKGGKYAGVNQDTKNIIIEAANFHPTITRKTARGLGIVIDASKRFENEPSRDLPLYAQSEIIKLIQKIAGGEFDGLVDKYVNKKSVEKVEVTVEKTNSLLGLSLSEDEITGILFRIGATVESIDTGVFSVTAPFERNDLNIEEDYIEEVGRIYGLAKIKAITPEVKPVSEINSRQYYSEKIRQNLLEISFSEVITSSFQKKDKIQLQNSLASDKSYLRSSLRKNINAVLDANYSYVDLLGLNDVRVFEIGTVFKKTDAGVGEYTALTIGVRSKGNGFNPKDDVILQKGIEAVERVVGDTASWHIEAGVAETNLSDVLDKLPAPTAYDPVKLRLPVTYKAVSPYPAVARDIALWVKDTESADEVIGLLIKSAGDLCVRYSLFDTFTKDGRTSYAFRLIFQSSNRTLTDHEVNEIMMSLYEIAAKLGWEVR